MSSIDDVDTSRFWAFVDHVRRFPDRYGRLVHLAVKRFEADQARTGAGGWPFVMDWAKGFRAVRYIELLYQSKGEFSRRPLALAPFQVFNLVNLFGWVDRETGYRRFRIEYISVARGNGKSTLSAGKSLYLADADKEPAAEIFLGANTLFQAGAVFDQVAQTVTLTPGLPKRLRVQKLAVYNPKTFTSIKKIASDATTLDGLNPHACVLDEVHEFRNAKLYNVLRGAMGKRRQPVLSCITTAGFDMTYWGFKLYEYAVRVLEGTHEDVNFFALIFSIDEDDDPYDEAVWIKANPLLGVSVSLDDLRQQARSSKVDPTDRDDFIVKRMNRYIKTSSGWLGAETWLGRVREVPEEDLAGLPCFGALDMSKSGDFTVYALTFPSLGNHTVFRYFLPSANFRQRVEFENNYYQGWVEAGHLELIEGPIIRDEVIVERILADAERFKIQEMAFDPGYAKNVSEHLEKEGVNMIKFVQTDNVICPATAALEKDIKLDAVTIDPNPITLWMAGNVRIEHTKNDEIRPAKGTNKTKRIDGIVALIMSTSAARRAANREAPKEVVRLPFTML